MSYRLEFTSKARNSLSRLPANIRARVAERITSLTDNPRPVGALKVKGQDDCYRIRQGDYRIVYTVIQDRLIVLIVRVGHRKEVYEQMETVARIIERFRKSGG